MKKQFGKLSEAEQESWELAYYQMNPHDFDEAMKQANRQSPEIIRLLPKLIESLKKQASDIAQKKKSDE